MGPPSLRDRNRPRGQGAGGREPSVLPQDQGLRLHLAVHPQGPSTHKAKLQQPEACTEPSRAKRMCSKQAGPRGSRSTGAAEVPAAQKVECWHSQGAAEIHSDPRQRHLESQLLHFRLRCLPEKSRSTCLESQGRSRGSTRLLASGSSSSGC